ncbi:MAG: PAS domain-containing sensor histidine kinase [bacterium]|nr:PAS domain-containing sensor histidine kinase [bacterium]
MKSLDESRYKQLVENLNDAVYTVDVKTLTFTSANPKAEQITGYKSEELLGMPIVKIIAPSSMPVVKKMIARKHKQARSTIYEVELVRKDGSLIPVEISSLAVYKNDVPIEILGAARDITERRALDMQRNVFISLLTHEIKNPLTSVKLNLGLLKKRVTNDDKSLGYVSTIFNQLDSIDHLMADFLDAIQMRVGKFQIVMESFDIDQLIVNSIRDHEIVTHTIVREGSFSGKVIGDKHRIRQVMTNFLTNAIKYSPEGSLIVVSVKSEKNKITVGVKNEGVGIPKDEQKTIFDLFIRTREATQRNIKGHGLGLFICREIIKLHKGKIWMNSSPGKGSAFYFSLKL